MKMPHVYVHVLGLADKLHVTINSLSNKLALNLERKMKQPNLRALDRAT